MCKVNLGMNTTGNTVSLSLSLSLYFALTHSQSCAPNPMDQASVHAEHGLHQACCKLASPFPRRRVFHRGCWTSPTRLHILSINVHNLQDNLYAQFHTKRNRGPGPDLLYVSLLPSRLLPLPGVSWFLLFKIFFPSNGCSVSAFFISCFSGWDTLFPNMRACAFYLFNLFERVHLFRRATTLRRGPGFVCWTGRPFHMELAYSPHVSVGSLRVLQPPPSPNTGHWWL